MPLQAGTVVGDRYRLVEPLASGGMGTVWRARHTELDVDVALKVVSAELLKTPTAEKRFRREAQAAAKLRSPHIVHVLDYGVFEGQPYLAMEMLEGEDLASRLAREGPMSPHACAEVIDSVAKALQLSHEAGIVHRDLKPPNIFIHQVGDEQVVKVLDFGIAKEIDGLPAATRTTASGLVGSPAYMSPEQVWGETVGPPADTWAMAVVAYEMLTGFNPFNHEVLAQVFDRIVKTKVPPVAQFAPGIPDGVDAFFLRALRREASGRFQSAREFAQAFRAALGATGADSRPGLAPPHVDVTLPTNKAGRPSVETASTLAAPATMQQSTSGGGGKSKWVMLALAVLGLGVASSAVWSLREPAPSSPTETGAATSNAALDPTGTWIVPPAPSAQAKAEPSAALHHPDAEPTPSSTPFSVARPDTRPRPAPAATKVDPRPAAQPEKPQVDPKWGLPTNKPR